MQQKIRFYLCIGIAGVMGFSNMAWAENVQTEAVKPFRLTGSRSAPIHVHSHQGKMRQGDSTAQLPESATRLNQTQINTAKKLDEAKRLKHADKKKMHHHPKKTPKQTAVEWREQQEKNAEKRYEERQIAAQGQEKTAAPLDKTKEVASNAWEGTKEAASNTWEGTKDVSADVWEGTKDAASNTWEGTKDVSADAWEGTKEAASNAWEKTKDVSADVWEGTKDATSNAWENTKEALTPNAEAAQPVKPKAGKAGKPVSFFFKESLIKGRSGGDVVSQECDKGLRECPVGISGGDAPLLEKESVSEQKPIVHGKSARGRQAVSPSFLSRADKDLNSWANSYTQAKSNLTKETGLSYTIDVSYMGQRGAPNGHITPWQSQYYGALSWDMFSSDTWGRGSANLAYEMVRYWNGSGAQLGNNIGVATPLNDYTTKGNYFYELSYTHQLPGKMNWLSVTLGQFPMYNFDGMTYDSNQQINFINESFSQNASSTYPSAGLGGYITIAPNQFWSFSAGGQDASNIEGNRISTSNWGKKFTSFVSGTINPQNRLGQASISLLLYNQPSVAEQSPKTQGWSLNAQQNIGKKLAVFMRANGVNKGVNGISRSYVLGGVYNNPLNRNTLDQIGLSGGVNKLDHVVNEGARSYENMLEAYWAWGISSFMTITPDVQFYINPGLNKKSNTATVASIRATMMF